jgi:uncharacterized protein YqeY
VNLEVSLSDKLVADMKEAMKQKDKVRLATIRMVRAAQKEAEIDHHKELDDQELTEIIVRQVKIRKDALPEYEKANRVETVQQLQEEIEVLQGYLPEQLSEDEIRDLIRETIKKTGAKGPQDMGKVMKDLMPGLKGRADGKIINQLVKEILQ